MPRAQDQRVPGQVPHPCFPFSILVASLLLCALIGRLLWDVVEAGLVTSCSRCRVCLSRLTRVYWRVASYLFVVIVAVSLW